MGTTETTTNRTRTEAEMRAEIQRLDGVRSTTVDAGVYARAAGTADGIRFALGDPDPYGYGTDEDAERVYATEREQREASIRAERETWIRTHCYHCGEELPARTTELLEKLHLDGDLPEDEMAELTRPESGCSNRCFEG